MTIDLLLTSDKNQSLACGIVMQIYHTLSFFKYKRPKAISYLYIDYKKTVPSNTSLQKGLYNNYKLLIKQQG